MISAAVSLVRGGRFVVVTAPRRRAKIATAEQRVGPCRARITNWRGPSTPPALNAEAGEDLATAYAGWPRIRSCRPSSSDDREETDRHDRARPSRPDSPCEQPWPCSA